MEERGDGAAHGAAANDHDVEPVLNTIHPPIVVDSWRTMVRRVQAVGVRHGNHGKSPIFGPPSITEKRFVNHLRAAKRRLLVDEGPTIYRRLVNNGFDPLIALGQFQAESGLGTKGHATRTRNWGNILFYKWTAELGAVDFAPDNGFHYSGSFGTWTQGARAYIRLMKSYESRDFDTVEKWPRVAWDKVGTPRTNRYVDNILQASARFAASAAKASVSTTGGAKQPAAPAKPKSPTRDVRQRQVRRHAVGDRQTRASIVKHGGRRSTGSGPTAG